ncbi:hypothetical protein [Marinoscillum sp. MHG1-6]|uniref:hypothetical protein n=1 Tax=Marinoscillum sp. MHG1-6 TaxID=2959627 RepID=UPI002157C675|nr:hypothetical protein [Marinoscillum sp. MHG1-6]
MKRSTLFLIGFILVFVAQAQYKPQSQRSTNTSSSKGLKDRIYFGGGGGFSGGTNYVNVSVSPLIGYKITNRFSTGLRFTYQFVKINDLKFNYYGLGPFARYNITEKFFTYTEYEYLNFEIPNFNERDSYHSWFVGLGYSEPITRNIAFNVSALYNLLYSDGTNSPYASPLVFRVGIVGGLF